MIKTKDGKIRRPKIVNTVVLPELNHIRFEVETNYRLFNQYRDSGLDPKKWIQSGCIYWLRQQGIERHNIDDVKFCSENVRGGQGTWTLTTHLYPDEQLIIKMQPGISEDES